MEKIEKRSFYDEISNNKRDAVLLVMLVIASVIFIGWFIGWFYDPSFATTTLIIAAFVAVMMSWAGYYYSDSIVLSTVNAYPADEDKFRKLHDLVEGLALGAGLPKPRIYVIKSQDINAFATGRNPEHAIIAVTEGALANLDRDELEGVLAHELSHIRNYDILFMTLVATLVGVIVILSTIFRRSLWFGGGRRDREDKGNGGLLLLIGLLFAILAPILMKLIQLAVSRKREYLADASGAEISRNPDGLADALDKIKKYNQGRLQSSEAINHLFFANPLRERKIESLFSTHPPLEDRIERLRNM